MQIDILILIRNYNMYDVCTHVIQSITWVITYYMSITYCYVQNLNIHGKFKYKYSNNNSCPKSSVAHW